MNFRWFTSSQARQATDLYDHVLKLRNAQCDILAPQALAALDAALGATKKAIDDGASDEELAQTSAALEKACNQWIKPYPNTEWRENFEVFLVAIVVAMAIRTFFLQPFKIPTGSMQPTLFGVTVEAITDRSFQMPGFFGRVGALIMQGSIYHEAVAAQDGYVERVGTLEHFLRFFNKQTIWVHYADNSDVPITFWFTPDPRRPFNTDYDFADRIGLKFQAAFKKGEPIVRFVETTGDHLFVDRFTYNFRRPQRGEIIVFQTKGLHMPGFGTGEPPQFHTDPSDNPPMGSSDMDQDQFYIKRLIGLPGEKVSIGFDDHVRINGQRLDASSYPPHFANLYGFDPNSKAHESEYHGHVLDSRSELQKPDDYLQIRDKHYVVFGDNTMNSLDSRYWGDFPQENVIGKSWFVYWPITSRPPRAQRFGWGQR